MTARIRLERATDSCGFRGCALPRPAEGATLSASHKPGGAPLKRDDNLIREILIQVEASPANQEPVLRFPEKDRDVLLEHIELLDDAGLVEANIMRGELAGERIHTADISRMTAAGHDFLNNIRNPKVWERIRKVVAEKGGSVSFEVLRALAVQTAKKYFLDSEGG